MKSIFLAVALLSVGFTAFGIQRKTSEVKVAAVDAHSRSVNDLQQEEFVLYVDKVEKPISWWMKVQNLRGHSVYTLRFEPGGTSSVRRHEIDIQVKRLGIKLKYPQVIEY
jgi:hypothetical protein